MCAAEICTRARPLFALLRGLSRLNARSLSRALWQARRAKLVRSRRGKINNENNNNNDNIS